MAERRDKSRSARYGSTSGRLDTRRLSMEHPCSTVAQLGVSASVPASLLASAEAFRRAIESSIRSGGCKFVE